MLKLCLYLIAIAVNYVSLVQLKQLHWYSNVNDEESVIVFFSYLNKNGRENSFGRRKKKDKMKWTNDSLKLWN